MAGGPAVMGGATEPEAMVGMAGGPAATEPEAMVGMAGGVMEIEGTTALAVRRVGLR